MPPHALRSTYELDPGTGPRRSTDPFPNADPLCRWAAGHPDGGSRIFVRGAAVAVAAPGLSMRDRLVVTGPPADAVPLVRDVLDAVGPGYRPLGDRALIDALVARLPGLHPAPAFGWMDRSTTHTPQPTDRPPPSTPLSHSNPSTSLSHSNPSTPSAPHSPHLRRLAHRE